MLPYYFNTRLSSKNNDSANENDYFKFIPKVIAFSLFLSVLYSIFKLNLVYYIFLHIPIFQYVEISEIVLFAPSAIFFSFIYYLSFYLNIILFFFKELTVKKAFFLIASIAIIPTGYVYISLVNNPSNFNDTYFLILFLSLLFPLILISNITVKHLKTIEKIGHFQYVILLLVGLTFYNGTIEGLLTNYSLRHSENYVHLKIKLADGKIIKSNSKFKYVGRTKEYWFFFDTKNKTTRVINNSSVLAAEFKSGKY